MTSKRQIIDERDSYRRSYTEVSERLNKVLDGAYKTKAELDAYRRENEAFAAQIQLASDHHDHLVQFIDDLFVIEPQLKHTLTNGVWDFERVHRAAEALRAEDALASVGYTDQCIEWPDNVTPLFPHDPSNGRGAA